MKEFELTLRLRNNLLKRRRVELGLSARNFAAAANVGYWTYLKLEGLKHNPRRSDGTWSEIALRIAAFHCLSPEELWPAAILGVQQPQITTELAATDALRLAGYATSLELPPTPEELLLLSERNQQLKTIMDSLAPLYRRVLTWRAEGMTLDEIGEKYDLSRERIRQILLRAEQRARQNALKRSK